MKHTEVVKQAFQITFRHPVLWIFGILLALTSGGGGNQLTYSLGDGNRRGVGNIPPIPGIERLGAGFWIGVALLCCGVLLLVILVSIIVQYVSRTALYRMVDGREETGSMPTWREGFRLGWSNRAFRIFLLELIVGIIVAVAAIILLALAATPLLLLLIRSPVAIGFAIGLTVVLELLVILVLIVAGISISVLGQFWYREIALADRRIGEAFSSGYQLVRSRLKDVGLMWLLLVAIGLVYGLVVIPLAIGVVLAALVAGGGVGYGIYAAAHSVLWGVIAGLPVFLVIVIVPLTFVHGLYLVFSTSAWTLTYREVARPISQPAGVAGSLPAA